MLKGLDWKDQPDLEVMNELLTKFERPRLYPVDTEQDSIAVVVAEPGLTRKQAQELYDKAIAEDEHDDEDEDGDEPEE